MFSKKSISFVIIILIIAAAGFYILTNSAVQEKLKQLDKVFAEKIAIAANVEPKVSDDKTAAVKGDVVVPADGTSASETKSDMKEGDKVANKGSEKKTNSATEVQSDKNPSINPEKKEILPSLNKSDKIVLLSASTLSTAQNFSKKLVENNVISRFVVFTDNLSRGAILGGFSPLLKPQGQFLKYDKNGSMFLSPAGYKRYNSYANIINKLNLRIVMKEYRRFMPLIDKAYNEIGYDKGEFTETLIEAINNINSAPIIKYKIKLVAPSAMYKFANSKLEGLNHVQKQMIRMGPYNTRIIQTKLAKLKKKLVAMRDKEK